MMALTSPGTLLNSDDSASPTFLPTLAIIHTAMYYAPDSRNVRAGRLENGGEEQRVNWEAAGLLCVRVTNVFTV